MAKQVKITLADPRGLDDPKKLQAELERETGVPWKVTEQPDDGHLSATLTIVLTAVAVKVMDKITDKAVDAATDLLVERARKVVGWFKERYVDPPKITVEVADDLDEDATDSRSADPELHG